MGLLTLIKQLKNDNQKLTTVNPLLDAIDLNFCQYLEALSDNEIFLKGKIRNIINLLEDCGVGYEEKLKSAFEAYNEIYNYYLLSRKVNIQRIKEATKQTPDFKIVTNYGEAFI